MFHIILITNSVICEKNKEPIVNISNVNIEIGDIGYFTENDEKSTKLFLIDYNWDIINNNNKNIIVSAYHKSVFDSKKEELIIEYFSYDTFPNKENPKVSSHEDPFYKLKPKSSKKFNHFETIKVKRIKLRNIKFKFWYHSDKGMYIEKNYKLNYNGKIE